MRGEFAFLCEYACPDNLGRICAQGVYNGTTLRNVPGPWSPGYLVARLVFDMFDFYPERIAGEIEVELYGDYPRTVSRGPVTVSRNQPVEKMPLRMSGNVFDVCFPIPTLLIPEPGDYHFTLLLNGHRMASAVNTIVPLEIGAHSGS